MKQLLIQLERNHWKITHRADGKPMPQEDIDVLIAALRHHIADEATRVKQDGLIGFPSVTSALRGEK